MAWRGVHISSAARLSITQRQLCVSQEDGEVSLPLEDLAYVVFDTPRATITTAALSGLLETGAVIVHCDAKHTPAGIALPFHAHHRQGGVARDQVAIALPFKKRCWQAIVRTKIYNQSSLIETSSPDAAAKLLALRGIVGSGDPKNVEATAARIYWAALFKNFKRSDEEDRRNALLNYGYAILRACISRSVVATGFLPAFGLHHNSATNAFNLSDDLIEPFRPFVDAAALARFYDAPDGETLSLEDRRAMAATPNQNALLGDAEMTVLAACEQVAQSLARAVAAKDWKLLELPSAPSRIAE